MIGIDFGFADRTMTSTYVVQDGEYVVEIGKIETHISDKYPAHEMQRAKNEICEMLSNRFCMKVIQETP